MKKGIVLLTALMLLTGCGSSEIVETPVKTCMVSERSISRKCVLSGKVIASSEPTTIKSELVGTVVDEVCVELYDEVRKGDVICRFNTADIEKQIEELEEKVSNKESVNKVELEKLKKAVSSAKTNSQSKLDHIRSNINDLKYDLDDLRNKLYKAESDYEEYKASADEYKGLMDYEEDPEAKQDYYEKYSAESAKVESYYSAVQQYREQISAAENAIKQAEYTYQESEAEGKISISQAEYELEVFMLDNDLAESENKLSELRRQLDKAEIKATEDGYISQLWVSSGRLLSEGAVAEISDNSSVKIEAYVSDEYRLSIENGTEVTFSTSGSGTEKYKGKIVELSNIRSDMGFKAMIQPLDVKNLIAGMTASIDVQLEERTVESLPFTAISVSKGVMNEKCIYIVDTALDGSKVAKAVEVSTGISDESFVEVISEEIPDYAVVIEDAGYIYDGMPVKVVGEG